MVADETCPLHVGRGTRPVLQCLEQRAGVGAGQGQVESLHSDEVELHVQFVSVWTAEEFQLIGVRQVDFSKKDRLAVASAEERPQLAKVEMWIGDCLFGALNPEGFHKERHCVDSESG